MADDGEAEEGSGESTEEKPSGKKFKFSLNLQPLWSAIGRVLWMGAIGVIVMGTYVIGTRYEISGSRKPIRLDRMTGKVKWIATDASPKTAPGGYLLQKYYLSPDQIKALKKLAETQKRDISEVAREAIESYLDSENNRTKRDKRRKPDL